MTLPLVVLLSLAVGLPMDVLFPAWGHLFVAVWNTGLLGLVMWRATPARRLGLVWCLLLASLGEVLLGEVWNLYDYAAGGIPLYIPPGHVLVFAAALELARRAPRWLPRVTIWATLAYAIPAVWSGLDTAALLWAPVLLLSLRFGRDRALYATMAWCALAIELWGTWLGAWWYFGDVPFTGLVTPNPPILAGAFYCLLDLLALALTRATQSAWPATREKPEARSRSSFQGR